MASTPINPTALTPPRVAVIDDRTGAISREWYRFFLSLVTATSDNQTEANTAPNTTSLLASYDAMLTDVEQSLALTPRDELGTLSYLQQDNVPWVTFSPVPTNVPVTVGTAFWNGGQTLNVQQTLNVAGKINEDNFYYIKADSAISKGQLVMFTGTVGASGVLRGAPATGLGVNDGIRLMGIAAENIAINAFGLVQWAGTLRGFNTTGAPYGETWADGDILYYNPAYAGGLTKVEPTAPNVKAVIAAVGHAGSAGSGSVVIRLSIGSVLGGTDSNVYINALANGDILQYDNIQQRWENTPLGSPTLTPGSVVFVGTAGVLAQDNSTFYWDTANKNLAIGRQTAANVRVYVKGGTTGNGAFQFYSENSAGTGCFAIRDDGGIYTGAAAVSPYNLTTAAAANLVVAADRYLYRSTSSARYKTKIADYDKGLDALKELRPVYYEGRTEIDAGKRFAGFIAEDVYEAGFAEFVVLDAEDKPDALHYGNMTALLVKALQDASKEIDSLTARVAALERR